ncbi:hypothetical protein SAMN04488564_10262 [Lentzea waywayandensis]|uniref:Uncharacterized protein n=1 Tax=Lentzea waywayandensis TaxID=84724 RepID=A0A1I6D9N3_9PSEU|nr:hypothetical protein SAMN04488564_10262 [Lentzea waywayandensis]
MNINGFTARHRALLQAIADVVSWCAVAPPA